MLGITSGHVDMGPQMTKEYINAHDHLSMLCDGPDDCVRAVREQFRMGAKFIKICATGGVSSPTDRVDDVQFSPEELRAIVGEAERHTPMSPPTALAMKGLTRRCWRGSSALSTGSCSPSGRST